MKINAQKIKNKIFNSNRDKVEMGINVSRDWILLLSIFIVVLFTVFIVGIYFLFKINSERQITLEIRNYIQTINRNEMQNILDEYGAKKDAFENLLIERTRSIDPSL